jgi:hypothetical protein
MKFSMGDPGERAARNVPWPGTGVDACDEGARAWIVVPHAAPGYIDCSLQGKARQALPPDRRPPGVALRITNQENA